MTLLLDVWLVSLVSAVPPGRQPVIGVQQSNVQRNDTAYNPLLVAKRQFAAAVPHNVDASLAVPRRFKRDVILSQRLSRLPWCLRVGDMLNQQQNVRRNVRNTIIGKLVDQSLETSFSTNSPMHHVLSTAAPYG